MNEHSWRELVAKERPVGLIKLRSVLPFQRHDAIMEAKAKVKNPETINYRTFSRRRAGFLRTYFWPDKGLGMLVWKNTSASSTRE